MYAGIGKIMTTQNSHSCPTCKVFYIGGYSESEPVTASLAIHSRCFHISSQAFSKVFFDPAVNKINNGCKYNGYNKFVNIYNLKLCLVN